VPLPKEGDKVDLSSRRKSCGRGKGGFCFVDVADVVKCMRGDTV